MPSKAKSLRWGRSFHCVLNLSPTIEVLFPLLLKDCDELRFMLCNPCVFIDWDARIVLQVVGTPADCLDGVLGTCSAFCCLPAVPVSQDSNAQRVSSSGTFARTSGKHVVAPPDEEFEPTHIRR